MSFVEVSSEYPLYAIAQGIPTAFDTSAKQFGIHEFEEWWGGPAGIARRINFVDCQGHPCAYALDGHGTLWIQAGSEPSQDGLAFWEAAFDQLGGKIGEAMTRQGYTSQR